MKIKKFQAWLLESNSAPLLTRDEVIKIHFSPVDQFTAVSDSDREVTVKLEKSKDEQFFCTVKDKEYGVLDWSAEPYASEEDAIKEFKALTKIDVLKESFSAKSIRGYSTAKEKWEKMNLAQKKAIAEENEIEIDDFDAKFDLLDTHLQVALIKAFVGSVSAITTGRISEAEEATTIEKAVLDKYRKYSTMNEDQLKREIERMSTQKKAKSPSFDNDAYRVAYYYLSQKATEATEAPGASAQGSPNVL